jgi:hypothetical protein
MFSVMQAELEEQNRREMAEIEQRLRHEAEASFGYKKCRNTVKEK